MQLSSSWNPVSRVEHDDDHRVFHRQRKPIAPFSIIFSSPSSFFFSSSFFFLLFSPHFIFLPSFSIWLLDSLLATNMLFFHGKNGGCLTWIDHFFYFSACFFILVFLFKSPNESSGRKKKRPIQAHNVNVFKRKMVEWLTG